MMTHPNDSKWIDKMLDGRTDPETESHFETCQVCREKYERMAETRERLMGHEISDCDPVVAEDLFAAAWTGSRDLRKATSPAGAWRARFQPAGLFLAGLLLGYLLFSAPSGNPGTVVLPPTSNERGVANKDPVEKKAPAGRFPSDYWEKAGFKNAKFTPTVRYEDGRNVWGGTLEAETPGGALVVMNY